VKARYLIAALLLVSCRKHAPGVESVRVHTTAVKRTLSATFHGINYVAFWDKHQGSLQSKEALSRTAIRMVRFPGGDPGNFYDWRCPYYAESEAEPCPPRPVAGSTSSSSPMDVWSYAHDLGGKVLFQTNTRGGQKRHPSGASSAQSAGDWAADAKARGMAAEFEIGNEDDVHMRSKRDATFQSYLRTFDAQARAIHAASPGTRVFGPAGTNQYYWWALDSLGMFLEATGNKRGSGQADGVSLHFYLGSRWEDSIDVAQAWLRPDGPWAFIHRTVAANDSRALPVYISEWHVGPSEPAFNTSMANALLTADLIGAFAESGVAGHQYFAMHGVDLSPFSFGLLYGANDTRPPETPTPTYYAFTLWAAMGDRVLGLEQSSDARTELSSYATSKADGSVQVLSINKASRSTRVKLSLDGVSKGSRGVTISVLSPKGDRTSRDVLLNGVQNPPVAALPPPRSALARDAQLDYDVPASSIALVTLLPPGAPPR
jgi:hypothetical protein